MIPRKVRLPLLLAVASVSIFASVMLASATSTGQFTSEGCTGYGDSFVSGSEVHIDTVAWLSSNGSTPCNWVYLHGWYYNANNQWAQAGPGWYQLTGGSFGIEFFGPSGFTEIGVYPATHSFCWAGGPCSNSVPATGR